MKNPVFILVFIIVVFIAGALLYIYNPAPTEYKNPSDNQGVCTLDAKLCPDGTYVGRQGPNCEFAPCPMATSAPAFEEGTTTPSAPELQ
jgi:hypothetical protein